MTHSAGWNCDGRSRSQIGDIQERHHGDSFDYERGSPHLRHGILRHNIVSHIRDLIAAQFSKAGSCRVLEVGAGHGGFTDHIAATGAELTVTEMSRPSLEVLRRRLEWNPNIRLVYDPDGGEVFREGATYDLVLCVSVLHHIPDYLAFVRRLLELTAQGGAFASFQDPLWYPRCGALTRYANWGAFYAWRLGAGNFRQGLATVRRRAKGVYDEESPSDMVEFHVVRSGVDEHQLESLLYEQFRSVGSWRYWSTQSPLLQAVGTRLGLETTFGLIGCDRFMPDEVQL